MLIEEWTKMHDKAHEDQDGSIWKSTPSADRIIVQWGQAHLFLDPWQKPYLTQEVLWRTKNKGLMVTTVPVGAP